MRTPVHVTQALYAPRWVTLRRDGTCPCGARVPAGTRTFYAPRRQLVHCHDCSLPAAIAYCLAMWPVAQDPPQEPDQPP